MLLTETYFANAADKGTNDFETQMAVFQSPYSSTWPSLFVCILIWQQCPEIPRKLNMKRRKKREQQQQCCQARQKHLDIHEPVVVGTI